jgi:hypothetical protein
LFQTRCFFFVMVYVFSCLVFCQIRSLRFAQIVLSLWPLIKQIAVSPALVSTAWIHLDGSVVYQETIFSFPLWLP